MSKKTPMEKDCIQCGDRMIQPKWKNGNFDSRFHKRKFCGRACYRDWRLAQPPPTDDAGRRRAQKSFVSLHCSRCRATVALVRHHKNRNPMDNSPGNVEVLCHSCHNREHGPERRTLKPKKCPVCKTTFRPRKARDKLCKNIDCRREYGRRSARRRWGTKAKHPRGAG